MRLLNHWIDILMNVFRPDNQVTMVRGRWCSVFKIKPTVYRVSVLDTKGHYLGSRFITPRFSFTEEVDKAVHSVLVTRKTY